MQKAPIENSGSQRSRRVRTAIRYLICAAFLLVLGAFQTSFFGASGLFDATPDLLLSATVAISLFCGERTGAVCGIFAGIIAFSLGGSGTAFMPVFYCVTGFCAGVYAGGILRKNLLSWTVLFIMPLVMRSALSFIYILIAEEGMTALTALREIVLPEAVFTFAFSYLVFLLAKLVIRPFRVGTGKDDTVNY